MKYKQYLYYLTIILAVLWEIIQQYVLRIDGAGRIPFTISLIAFLFSFSDWKRNAMCTRNVIIFYFFLVVYELLNSLFVNSDVITNFSSSYITLIKAIAEPFMVMMVSYVSFLQKPKTTISVIFWSLFIFIIFVVLTGQTNTSFDDFERMSVEGLSTNTIANKSSLFLFFLVLNNRYNQWKPSLCVLLSLPALYLILKSGSRQSLFLVASLLVFISLIQVNSKKVFRLLLISLAVLFVASYILESTDFGGRIQSTTENVNYSYESSNGFLKYFGDRGPQYIEAAAIIPDHPIWGIGMRNFQNYSHNSIVFHSEYLIHLCECGIIAFIFYILYLLTFIKKLIKNRSDQIVLLCLCFFVGLIVLGLFTRICYHSYYFCFYGLALSLIDKINSENYEQTLQYN